MLKFKELKEFFYRDDSFKRFFEDKIDQCQMVEVDLGNFSQRDETNEQVMAHFFAKLPRRLDDAKLSLTFLGQYGYQDLESLFTMIISQRPDITFGRIYYYLQ